MSTHIIEIIEVSQIIQHPNPEVTQLEIIPIKGWQTCVRKGDFKVGDKAIYIPPDYIVPISNPSFSFLGTNTKPGITHARIKAKRLKGELSYGLLIHVPESLSDKPLGSNVIDDLNIQRYEPPVVMEGKSTRGQFESPPDLYTPVFDVENFQSFPDIFVPGEQVILTEKLDGSSARFTFAKSKDGEYKQFVGSRRHWFKEDDKNLYWEAFRQHPIISAWCQTNPDYVIYGEVFGPVQKLRYGSNGQDIFFAVFAILYKDGFLDFDEAYNMIAPASEFGLQWVPIMYRGPFNIESAKTYSTGNTTWPNAKHIREGIVIIPEKERRDHCLGRVILKMINPDYLIQS